MAKKVRKYIFALTALVLCGHMVFGISLDRASGSPQDRKRRQPLDVVVPPPDTDSVDLNAPGAILDPGKLREFPTQDGQKPDLPEHEDDLHHRAPLESDTTQNPDTRFLPDGFYRDTTKNTAGEFTAPRVIHNDSILPGDSLIISDEILISGDSAIVKRDTIKKEKKFLDDIMYGKNKDSLIYDVRSKMVYIYNDGDITYQDMNLKADYMEVSMETKIIYGYGVTDSLGNKSRPEFTESGSVYTMDTLTYNIDSKKAKIKGAATQEGDGFLVGRDIKKMNDNTVNIAGGKYTTCDNVEHPHFYLAMTKAKLIPGKKVIIGPSYMVLEDVPIYFPVIPFGFFPITSGRSSGFIIPSYGEETVKGFFLRDGGYYFAFNDYIDMTLLGGIYTLGSWEGSVSSRYVKRYKYAGGFNVRYTKNILGEKGAKDYVNSTDFNVQWTHTQDAKFRPNSTFSASVNFSSSTYNRYGSNTMNDYLSTQTNSSVAYSRSWPGKPFSLSTNFQHSQNSRDTTVTLSFPNVVFNVSRINPFKRKNAMGKERWYEKIAFTYTANVTNNVTVKEKELFKDQMFKDMRNGINHTIPVSASFNLFNYLNINPSFKYNERWFFRKIDKEWSPEDRRVIPTDTTYGFYRVYDYGMSVSASTKLYGMYTFKDKAKIKAIRHVFTPSLSFNYTPNFGDPKYGYWKPVQSDSTGSISYYSPYEGNAYGVPGRGESMSMSIQLQNSLEMKVRSDRDTTGERKIKLIDNLSFSTSYNFLADSLNLSPITVNLRTTIVKNFGLNINATFDPYQINENGTKINKFMINKGKLARLTSASTSFGYTFNSSKSSLPAMNDINSGGVPTPEQNDFFTNQNIVDPNMRRMMMTSQYYDFDIPWNLGFNYSFSYSKPGNDKRVTQTLGFNGSVTPTPKWGINFSGGYDFELKKLTPGVITFTRDLHCWQMNLSWVPIGYRTSWSFNISVKSAVLRDLKYDKRNSYYDNLYE